MRRSGPRGRGPLSVLRRVADPVVLLTAEDRQPGGATRGAPSSYGPHDRSDALSAYGLRAPRAVGVVVGDPVAVRVSGRQRQRRLRAELVDAGVPLQSRRPPHPRDTRPGRCRSPARLTARRRRADSRARTRRGRRTRPSPQARERGCVRGRRVRQARRRSRADRAPAGREPTGNPSSGLPAVPARRYGPAPDGELTVRPLRA
jgi:hypothetical protein